MSASTQLGAKLDEDIMNCREKLDEDTLDGLFLIALLEKYSGDETDAKALIMAVLRIIHKRTDIYEDMYLSTDDDTVRTMLQVCSLELEK
jgi:hypothetical protein